ncbi:type 1 glutamine amidotransferase [Litorilinea aerophila]|uniref:Type 1 glutamine amidotransferase n=1 Tax=Litorilinea aerophila TaxID=1204385 RepID=A0A540VLV2_9CHLR|nr:type 1 glutamine amidotransferase domain-containing protein [Litorilinea aerophila]MCC9075192.1 type 1 glutamine amidotransferase [Litorilinea aerophila]OUC09541.1 glutamine amidotransferase [Litorilinea aerophila]GIV78325.1 MAG: protease [Litorilinea sp.]
MSLEGKHVAVLAEDMYEDPELWYPYYRLLEAGARVTLVGPEAKTYTSKHGYPVKAEVAASQVKAADFDGVVVPGGFAPDRLRRYPEILSLVKGVHDQGGMVAAICHAAWVPISAGIMRGKRATCVSAIKDDLINAGAEYVDEPVVVDGKLVTSRTPADLPYFLPAIIAALES